MYRFITYEYTNPHTYRLYRSFSYIITASSPILHADCVFVLLDDIHDDSWVRLIRRAENVLGVLFSEDDSFVYTSTAGFILLEFTNVLVILGDESTIEAHCPLQLGPRLGRRRSGKNCENWRYSSTTGRSSFIMVRHGR